MTLPRRVILALLLVGSLSGPGLARGATVEEVFERARAGTSATFLKSESARGHREIGP
jgi:hypothetical protein